MPAAEEAAERIERRFRDAFAGELFGMRAVASDIGTDTFFVASPSLRASRALDYWKAAEQRALFRYEPGPIDIPDETIEKDRRMLPAQTFPGFRLTLPDCRDPELDMAYDFITAESAEGAE